MTERRLWILIFVLLVAIAAVSLAKRRWSRIDPDAAQEIEKAKQR